MIKIINLLKLDKIMRKKILGKYIVIENGKVTHALMDLKLISINHVTDAFKFFNSTLTAESSHLARECTFLAP